MALTKITSDGITDGTITGTDLATNIDLVDNQKIRFGTGNDLQIWHDGSDSNIADVGTGDLNIRGSIVNLLAGTGETFLKGVENAAVELYHDGTKKFQTESYGINVFGTAGVQGDLRVTGDNLEVSAGIGNDIKMYHDGTDSYLENATGDLYVKTANTGDDLILGASDDINLKVYGSTRTAINCIGEGGVELYYDNSKKFETTSYGAAVTGGINFSGDSLVQDNVSFFFGASNDLQIVHDASSGLSKILNQQGDLYINNFGTNADDIFIQAQDDISIRPQAGENGIKVIGNGAVELYYDNSKKLETKSNGVTVSSTANAEITITSATSGSATLEFGDTDDDDVANISYDNYNGFMMYRTSANADMRFYTNGSHRLTLHKSGYLAPATDSTYDIGTSSVRFANGYFDTLYGDGSNLTGISSDLVNDTSPQLGGDLHSNGNNIILGDSSGSSDDRIQLGASQDLQLYHNGTDSAIYDSGTGRLKLYSNGTGIDLMKDNAEAMIVANTDGAVELYHDNSKKFETTSAGATVTGTLNAASIQGSTIFNAFGGNLVLQLINGEKYFQGIPNAGVELFYDGTKKFGTTSQGATVTGTLTTTAGAIINGVTTIEADPDERLRIEVPSNNADDWNYIAFYGANGTRDGFLGTWSDGTMTMQTDNGSRLKLYGSYAGLVGNFLPESNNTYDLGSSSYRWSNIYTNDLNLSNEGGSNDVDASWGSYTIQEGAEDLFLINRRNGKKYKFNLTEVS